MWIWLWNWITGRDQKSFEVLDRKSLDCLEELLAEKWMLKEILVRTKKEKKSTVEKAFRACMYHREQNVAIKYDC